MPSSIELRQERARVVEQMRELVDRAETEDRDLTGEERGSYETGETDFQSLTTRIERAETQEQREADMAAPIPNGSQGGDSRTGETESYRRSDLPDDAEGRDQRMAFLDAFRHGRGGLSHEARALVEDTDGQILVPEALETEIRREIPALAIVRDAASQRTLTVDRVRRRSLDEVTVGWGSLETAVTPNLTDSMPSTPDEEYTYIEDLYGLAKIGEDELDDSDVNLEAFVRDSFARQIAETEDTAFTVGKGHTTHEQPVGLMTAGGGITAVDAGQVAAVTIDDFMKLVYAVPAQARRNGQFVMASATELAISTMKDTNDGQYLWQPSVQAGRPNSFLGFPILNQEDAAAIPASGTAAAVAAFGDWKQTYRVYDRLGLSMKRLEELYSEEGMVGFRVRYRVGGDVVNSGYARLLNVPAA